MRLWIKLFCILTFLAIVCSCSKDSSYDVSEEVDIVLSASFLDSCTVRSGNNSAEGGVANADWTKYDLRYIIEIYDADEGYTGELVHPRLIKTYDRNDTFMETIRLAVGRNYQFVVWTDMVEQGKSADLHYNTASFRNIGLNDYALNDESRDAYCVNAILPIEAHTSDVKLVLRRPFAKLRIMAAEGHDYASATLAYTTPVPAGYDLMDDELTDAVYDFSLADMTVSEWPSYTNEGSGARTLVTDYIFTTENSDVNFTLTLYDSNNEVSREVTLADVPLFANTLTSIVGI